MRAILFCNEMLGLGHVRLSLAVAQELVAGSSEATALVVSGSPAAGALRPEPRVDILKLPTLPPGPDSRWSATSLRPSAGLALAEHQVRALRRAISLSTVVELRPDIALVDYRPLGRGGELRPALQWLREQGDCTVALGLWDVDDAPEQLRRNWTDELFTATAELYDLALVYGPSAPGDLRIEGLRDAGLPVHHTGLVGLAPAGRESAELGRGYLLVTAGGGVDGFPLLDSVLAAIRLQPLAVPAVLVTGPMMAGAEVELLHDHSSGLDVSVERFRQDMDAALAGARAVVAMAGYCTVSEILGSGKPALLVPRKFPRQEQLNRARRWAAAGRVEMIDPDELEPELLAAALVRLIQRPPSAGEPLTGAADAARLLAGVRPLGGRGRLDRLLR